MSFLDVTMTRNPIERAAITNLRAAVKWLSQRDGGEMIAKAAPLVPVQDSKTGEIILCDQSDPGAARLMIGLDRGLAVIHQRKENGNIWTFAAELPARFFADQVTQ